MTNTPKNPGPVELTVAVAPVRARHRELVEAAVGWLAERGRAVDPDHLALICAGAEHAGEFSAEPEVTPTRWTRTGVFHVLRCDVPNWCSLQSCLWPVELPEAMWAWFDFLHDTGRLDRASDPLAELRKPLSCYGWLDQDGRPLPPDAVRGSVPCECLLPYRETVELLGELLRQCERTGDDPLDRLRWLVGRPPADDLPYLPFDPLDLDDLDEHWGWSGPER